MTKRLAFVAGIVLAVAAAGVGYFFVARPGHDGASGHRARSAPRATMQDEDADLPAAPEVSLRISNAEGAEIPQGTPLVFAVTLSNPRAENATATNLARETAIRQLEAAIAERQTSREEAAPRLAKLRRRREVRAVKLGAPGQAWTTFVRFELADADGRRQPLRWRVVPASGAPEVATVTSGATVEADYLLAPDVAAAIAPGDYRLVAVLDVPQNHSLPTDGWRGRQESDVVVVRVLAAPGDGASAAQFRRDLGWAEFAIRVNDNASALNHARQAVAVRPDSIRALVALGDAAEASGDVPAAIDAYRKALAEFERQHPNSYERPDLLSLRLRQLAAAAEPKAGGRPF